MPEPQQWCGRRVRVCDGTTVLMSDSTDNQAEYPQHSNQKEGCGRRFLWTKQDSPLWRVGWDSQIVVLYRAVLLCSEILQGFPIAKLVVIFSLVTGAVVAACIASFATSEIVMSRLLYSDLEPEEVLLADLAYGSYVDLSLLKQIGADGVFL